MLPKNLLKFELYFLSKKKLIITIFLFSLIFISSLEVIDAYIIKHFIDQITSEDITQSFMIKYVILFVVWWEMWNLSYRLSDYCLLTIMPALTADISYELTQYSIDHSHKYFQENFAGSIVNKIKELAKSSAKIFELLSTKIICRVFSIIFTIGLVSIASPIFSIIIMLWLLCFLSINYVFLKPIQRLSENFARTRSDTLGKLVDLINNISAVRLFANKKFELSFIGRYFEKTKQSDQKIQIYNNKINYLKGFINNILGGVIIYYMITLYQAHKITIGDFYLIFSAVIHITQIVWDFLEEVANLLEEIGTCKQSLTLISPRHEIEDAENAKELIVDHGNIKFEKVTFNYLKKYPLFENININIQGGSKVGLVGYSGSGKSTFVNLIIRLFDINAGKITIDGKDIKAVTQESLRNNIAFIPQEPILFHRTLIDNIRYGKLDATEEEVIEAAKLANAHEFILKTEFGYNSLVGERGLKLSGGQRQRIAIARAALKNAPILILDEATSSLDSITERKIQQSLDILMQNRTTLVIAHRLSTLLNMDRIIVFHEGKIAEDGTHQDLLAKGGVYTQLWNSQIDGFIGYEEDSNEE